MSKISKSKNVVLKQKLQIILIIRHNSAECEKDGSYALEQAILGPFHGTQPPLQQLFKFTYFKKNTPYF
jgi:hypothetical protein